MESERTSILSLVPKVNYISRWQVLLCIVLFFQNANLENRTEVNKRKGMSCSENRINMIIIIIWKKKNQVLTELHHSMKRNREKKFLLRSNVEDEKQRML